MSLIVSPSIQADATLLGGISYKVFSMESIVSQMLWLLHIFAWMQLEAYRSGA